ncbi:Mannose-1-phosphate guanylyltransferase [Rickettsia akari str. Hartford]|uniref:Mannose-1-phosphate guanylyltransferase n=1 Tax=Rickettsia akari (strain Hartford) TaxID=293614 RepID=A8GPI4_RICAH|nr:mannose-1-phosphate guanylyltransferase [Rickettsia akari]ABV75309.1 Mannose-1-phosphate guanylyltransferase [Rickettsia akari str. Hartford]
MIQADFVWNDLGTWHSLLQLTQPNINDNYCEGNVVTSNTTNSLISSNNKLTNVVDLENIIIIDTVNGLVVGDKSKINTIQDLVLIGSKLGNTECTQLIDSYPTKYTSFEYTVNNFIQNYVGQSDITSDNAILSAACSDTLNIAILGDINYKNMYNQGWTHIIT